MTTVQANEYTQEWDLVDSSTGEIVESVDDLLAARALARMYNNED